VCVVLVNLAGSYERQLLISYLDEEILVRINLSTSCGLPRVFSISYEIVLVVMQIEGGH